MLCFGLAPAVDQPTMDIYQVFHDLPAREGNFVAITGINNMAAVPLDASTSGTAFPSPALTQCRVTHSYANNFQVNCQQWNRPIQCCGHGLLAAAHALFESGEYSSLEFDNGVSAERAPHDHDHLQTWLHLPALATSLTDVPRWSQRLLLTSDGEAVTPATAATTNREDGYLLLQLDNQVSIETLRVDLDVITQHTRQAVLLWQLDNSESRVVRMRYFAPQYGNDEDAATGSVLRVLAPHLLRTADLESFDVIQCSASGGRMTAQNRGDRVAISGNVRLVDSRGLPAQ